MNKKSSISNIFKPCNTSKVKQSCDWLYGREYDIESHAEPSRYHPNLGLGLARKRGHLMSRKETQRPEVNAKY